MSCVTKRYGFFANIFEDETMLKTHNLHAIFTLVNKHGVSVQSEEYPSLTIEKLNQLLVALYLEQRTAKDFVRITVDIALPEN